MNDYSGSITPDSLSGIIFALEGVRKSVVLLNGPTGCKFYHSAISDNQTIKQFEFDPLNYPEKFFFGQPRVPCTYLDTGDYVYGSKEKLTEALELLRDQVSFELLAIVNSPGAALIGDDLAGVVQQVLPNHMVLVMETPGFSSDICHGFETASVALLERVLAGRSATASDGASANAADAANDTSNSPAAPLSVNILGLSLHHKYFTGDSIELQRLLALCGIQVNCFLCAESSISEIEAIPSASLNIVLHPEYGLRSAEYLQARFGTPYLCAGLPIGFAATETFISQICAQLNVDSAGFFEESERARARAYSFISRVNSLTGLPKGVGFAVEGTYSELYAYISFIVYYLAMIPGAIQLLNPQSDCSRSQLVTLLEDLGLDDLLEQLKQGLVSSVSQANGQFSSGQVEQQPPTAQPSLEQALASTGAEILLASGTTIARAKLSNQRFVGIETSLPVIGYLDVVPKTHLGIQGALLLTEQILNALLF